jgi:hypothetical protein
MKRLAIRSALSGKLADGQLIVVDELKLKQPKTREMTRILTSLGVERSALIVTGEADQQVKMSARNLPKTKVLPAAYLNVVDMLTHRDLVMTTSAVARAEALWGGERAGLRRAKPAAVTEPAAKAAPKATKADAVEPVAKAKPKAKRPAAAKAAPKATKASAAKPAAKAKPKAKRPAAKAKPKRPAAAKAAPKATKAGAAEPAAKAKPKAKRPAAAKPKTTRARAEKPKTTGRRAKKGSDQGEGR